MEGGFWFCFDQLISGSLWKEVFFSSCAWGIFDLLDVMDLLDVVE